MRAVIAAVVPAAGRSSRMGRPKLSLPLGGRTVLEHVVAALRAGGSGRVVVVVGPHVPELAPLAEAAGAEVCRLAEPTPDMRATVERGFAWLESPSPPDAVLLAPADHPTLDPAVVRDLCAALAAGPERSIVIPVHGGERGHPALLAWRHVAGIRALPPDRGINAYFRERGADVRELPAASPGVLCDLDTPADYDRLRRNWPPPAVDTAPGVCDRNRTPRSPAMTPLTLKAAAAADLMTSGPTSLHATATVDEAVRFLTEKGFGAAVVIDDAGHPLGVVTKTDVLVHERQRKPGLEPDDTPVTEFMTPAVFSVRPDTPARSVVEQLLALNVHHLFVADPAGVIVGVISPVDVLKKLG